MEPLQPIKAKKKHGCLIFFIVVIAVCILIGAFSSKFAPAEKSAPSSATATNSSATQDTAAKIGTEISNKKVSIKVNSVKEASSISDSTGYLKYTPDDGGKYILVNLTVKNVGDELYSFVVNNFQAESSDGKQYSPSVLISGNNYLNSGSINPGLSETGNIAFEVPKNVTPAMLTLEFQEFLSLDTADFALSK